jgi:hypothetical protein
MARRFIQAQTFCEEHMSSNSPAVRLTALSYTPRLRLSETTTDFDPA